MKQLVEDIRRVTLNGGLQFAPLARTRMQRDGVTPKQVTEAVLEGDTYACRETDRVKFVTDAVVAFVAYVEPPALAPSAVVAAAYAVLTKQPRKTPPNEPAV